MGAEKVSPLATQLPWTRNLSILSRAKWPEEREFYLRTVLRKRWSKRDLERQTNGALFEQVVVSSAKLSALLTEPHSAAPPQFLDFGFEVSSFVAAEG